MSLNDGFCIILRGIILASIFPNCCSGEGFSAHEAHIFKNKSILPNDDILRSYILQNHLFPPSNQPYQLKNPRRNPALHKSAVKSVFKFKRNGFFVEAGAHAGEWHSNTLELERNYGWTGLLIEANPDLFSELLEKQRKAWTSNTCLFSSGTPVQRKFNHHDAVAANGKVLGETGDHVLSLPEVSLMQPDHFVNGKKSDVACFPLESLLNALNRTSIDYLSLDVCGNELPVLDHIPLEKLNVKYVSVAHFFRPGGAKKYKSYIKNRGYQHLHTTGREMYFRKVA